MSVRELTPHGPGGVAVLEVRGVEATKRLAALAGKLPEMGKFSLVSLADGDLPLDEAIVVRLAEDHLEVHVTGSTPLVARLRRSLGGEDPAGTPGPVEERALGALRAAPCEAAARMLLDQARGALRDALEKHADAPPQAWRAFLAELRERGRVAEHLLAPTEVVLAGPANAGKSTLFNALVGTERVLVSAEAGTTRDAVTADGLLEGYPVRLVDTAGEREEPVESVERLGLEAGRARRRAARLTFWLRPADAAPDPPDESGDRSEGGDDERLVVIVSRADLARGPASAHLPSVSALLEPAAAQRTVSELFRSALDLPERPWRPGAAVPFEKTLVRGLAALVRLDGPAARRGSILRLLGARVVEGPPLMG